MNPLASILVVAVCFAAGFGAGWGTPRPAAVSGGKEALVPLKPIPRTHASVFADLMEDDRDPIARDGTELRRIREQTRGQIFEAMRATTRFISAAKPEDLPGLMEQIARQYRDEIIGDLLTELIYEKWIAVDPMGLLEVYESGRYDQFDHLDHGIYGAAIAADPDEAFRRLRDAGADSDELGAFLAVLTESDPAKSLAFFEELGLRRMPDAFEEALGSSAPELALSLERDRPQVNMVEAAMGALFEMDMRAALAQASKLEEPREAEVAYKAISELWYADAPSEFFEWVSGLPSRARQSRVAKHALGAYRHADNMEQILEEASHIPFRATRESFVRESLVKWAEWDRERAEAWMRENGWEVEEKQAEPARALPVPHEES